MSTKHRLYLKQAWNLMKQNRLFTSIYIAATAIYSYKYSILE